MRGRLKTFQTAFTSDFKHNTCKSEDCLRLAVWVFYFLERVQLSFFATPIKRPSET